MKQKRIGFYRIGYVDIEIILREGIGGEYYLSPGIKCGNVPRIRIGADYENWYEIVNVLLHEITEYLYDRIQCRYCAVDNLSDSHEQYLFVFNHAQFSDCQFKIANFLSFVLPDLEKIWNKWGKIKK
jgi:hypothetical protein